MFVLVRQTPAAGPHTSVASARLARASLRHARFAILYGMVSRSTLKRHHGLNRARSITRRLYLQTESRR